VAPVVLAASASSNSLALGASSPILNVDPKASTSVSSAAFCFRKLPMGTWDLGHPLSPPAGRGHTGWGWWGVVVGGGLERRPVSPRGRAPDLAPPPQVSRKPCVFRLVAARACGTQDASPAGACAGGRGLGWVGVERRTQAAGPRPSWPSGFNGPRATGPTAIHNTHTSRSTRSGGLRLRLHEVLA
jgi:hypothetical protein